MEVKEEFQQQQQQQKLEAAASITVETAHAKKAARFSCDTQLSTLAAVISGSYSTVAQNCIDLLRVLQVPEDDEEIDCEEEDAWLVPGALMSAAGKRPGAEGSAGAGSDSDNGGEGSSEEEGDSDYVEGRGARLAREMQQNSGAEMGKTMDPLLAELAGLNRPSLKRRRGTGTGGTGGTFERKKRRQSKQQGLSSKLRDAQSYRRAFSRAWLALLSLPALTSVQLKLLLRHLPEHVVPRLSNPLLLADFLSQTYRAGGLVAVLALESLFHLIASYNLDYPDFFLSLYNLCTVEVFSAKYRCKFMKLLNAALKSVNIPVYVVGAFVKRLARLALHSPTPNAPFFLAQCTWLLRQHPQSQRLIHSTRGKSKSTAETHAVAGSSSSSGASGGTSGGGAQCVDRFDNNESVDLDRAGALQSSLWEADALRALHLHGAALLAHKLAENKASTMSSATAARDRATGTATGGGETGVAAFIHVEDYLETSYASMLEIALAGGGGDGGAGRKKTMKRSAALAYEKPTAAVAEGGLVHSCFG